MNSVLNIIKETIITEEFKLIDGEIVYESLNCQVLRDLASQLYKGRKEEEEKLDKEYEEEKKKYDWARKGTPMNKTFKEIFGNEDIFWNKITDKDIEKYPATDDEKEQKKIDKKIREVIKGTGKILIAQNKDGEFTHFINTWGYLYILRKGTSYGYHQGSSVSRGKRNSDIPQYEKVEMLKGKTIYIISTSTTEMSNLHGERNRAKSGRIMLDPESLKKIAEQNIERYKKILREKRAKNLNDDELLNRIKKIINQVASYATMVAKDPIRHADLLADVSSLSAWIYDKRYYHQADRYHAGYYSGVNGLLPMMMKYTKLVKDLSDGGGYNYQNEDLKSVRAAMKDSIEKAETLLKTIEDKINA